MTSLAASDPEWVAEMHQVLQSIIDDIDERMAIVPDPQPPKPTGAYRLWLKELAAKKRTRTTFDALWRAAVHECNGIDLRRDGLWKAAAEEFATADRILEGKR